MLRSGSTLQYNIASELVERMGLGRREAWIDDHASWFASEDKLDGLTVFKSHVLTPEIIRVLSEGRGVILTSFRDIRDSVASWQAKNRRMLSVAEGLEYAAMAIDQFSRWEHVDWCDRVVSRYESMSIDIAGEVRRVAGCLGIPIEASDESCICKILSLPFLQNRISSMEEAGFVRSGGFAWDPLTLVHIDHLNGGIIGRAKSELSDDLYGALTCRYVDWLLAHGYSL